jgi:hypothetical protein
MKTYQTIPLSGQSNMVIRYLEGVGIASLSTKPVGRCGAGSATRPKKNYPRPARGPSLRPPPLFWHQGGLPPPHILTNVVPLLFFVSIRLRILPSSRIFLQFYTSLVLETLAVIPQILVSAIE